MFSANQFNGQSRLSLYRHCYCVTDIYIYNTLILYYTVCNYTCGPGEAANATCNGCNLIDICQRDIPCQNGGSCILLSAPNNYTCNCSGTGYNGTNCTGKLSMLVHTLCMCI